MMKLILVLSAVFLVSETPAFAPRPSLVRSRLVLKDFSIQDLSIPDLPTESPPPVEVPPVEVPPVDVVPVDVAPVDVPDLPGLGGLDTNVILAAVAAVAILGAFTVFSNKGTPAPVPAPVVEPEPVAAPVPAPEPVVEPGVDLTIPYDAAAKAAYDELKGDCDEAQYQTFRAIYDKMAVASATLKKAKRDMTKIAPTDASTPAPALGELEIPYDAAAKLAYDEWKGDGDYDEEQYQTFKTIYDKLATATSIFKKAERDIAKL